MILICYRLFWRALAQAVVAHVFSFEESPVQFLVFCLRWLPSHLYLGSDWGRWPAPFPKRQGRGQFSLPKVSEAPFSPSPKPRNAEVAAKWGPSFYPSNWYVTAWLIGQDFCTLLLAHRQPSVGRVSLWSPKAVQLGVNTSEDWTELEFSPFQEVLL